MKRKHLLVRNQSRGSGLPNIATLLLVALLSCIGTGAFAYDFSALNSDGVTIYYNYINNGQEAEVTYNDWNMGMEMLSERYSGNVTIPETVTPNGGTVLTVTSIGQRAFETCYGLTSVTIPNTVTSIGSSAFDNCSNLTSITIPNSVTSIGHWAFNYCINLRSITIPNSVTSICSGAFHHCTDLASIIIPNSVTSIDSGAFSDCSNLTSIEVEDGNDYYRMDGNCLIETASKTLIRGCGQTSITIPDDVTSIGKEAFYGCSNLTSIIIPNSVTNIGSDAFYGCSNLESVIIPSSVTNIGELAFWYCKGLKSVAIGNGVKSIGMYAFGDCYSLTSITIPNSVTSIGVYAFYYCTSLTEVTLQGTTLPTTSILAFNNISSEATLYCSAALLEKCRETEPWKNFKNIVAKPFSVTISDTGIATACSDKDLDFTNVEGVKAYIASGFNPTTGKVLMTRAMEIPAGTGFIVKGDEGTYDVPCSSTQYMYANLLVGVLADTTLSETDGTYTYYVLGKDDTDAPGFYLPSEGFALPANKAYLRLPTGTVSTAMCTLGISFGDEDSIITGFVSVKDLYNGSADKTDAIYNINGQRRSSLTRGLNIVNGKKIIVK